MAAPRVPILERLEGKIDRREDGCWFFSGYLKNGYGTIWIDGRDVYAHRAVYEAINSPIPEGHHLHHKCGVRRCVNPEHLTPLTSADHGRVGPGRMKVSLPFFSLEDQLAEIGLGLA